MDGGAITGMVAVIISVVTAVIGIINHKRIRMRSPCCDKEAVMSIDIEATSARKVSPESPIKEKEKEGK